MFNIRKSRDGCYTVQDAHGRPFSFTTNVVCITDILDINGKKYIRLQLEGGASEMLHNLDTYCSNMFSTYTNTIINESILVKIPYRYKRYEIRYITPASSDDLVEGARIKANLTVAGLYFTGTNCTCSYKLNEISQIYMCQNPCSLRSS